MLHYIHHGGKELPVDFNVWTLVRLAKAYNTDLSGLHEIFAKFDDCWSEYASLAEEAMFTYAFKLGMRIAIETLTK